MASRFVVALALFAVCQSGPVINGVRELRAYRAGIAEAKNYGGANKASAKIIGRDVSAESSNDDRGNPARDGLGNSYRGEANVKVIDTDTYDANYQPAYYHVPAPAPVVTYAQNFEVPSEVSYEIPKASATAQSTSNGYSNSNAQAQINDPTNVAAKTQGYIRDSVYVPHVGNAYSNAQANGYYGTAASSAKTGQVPTRKSISWRFGTAYDHPAAYTRSAPTYGSDYVVANSRTAGLSSSAQSLADAKSGTASAITNSNGGSANANAGVNNAGYHALRSESYRPTSYVASNTQGYGSANSKASITGDAISSAYSNGSGSSNSVAQAYSKNFADTHYFVQPQEVSAAYGVADSRASTFGSGSAAAKALSG